MTTTSSPARPARRGSPARKSLCDTGEQRNVRLTVPQGEWSKLTGLEGVNAPHSLDSFMSLTPDGQPAIMSRTGVAQLYLYALAKIGVTGPVHTSGL
jgi:hypothetical protein